MRSRVGIGIGLGILLLAAGCGQSHGLTSDSGPAPDSGPLDGGPPTRCTPGQTPPFDVYCSYVGSDHVCGDAAIQAQCVDGAWTCPAGTSSSRTECWCVGPPPPGLCSCMPGGWACAEPLDAGPPIAECPADPSSVVGSFCPVEGQVCGDCPDPCGSFCNQVSCIANRWEQLDLGCASPSFACGADTWCQRYGDYCQHTLSDVVGEPDDYRCLPFPQDCPADCTCFGGVGLGSSCSDDHAGGITRVQGGG